LNFNCNTLSETFTKLSTIMRWMWTNLADLWKNRQVTRSLNFQYLPRCVLNIFNLSWERAEWQFQICFGNCWKIFSCFEPRVLLPLFLVIQWRQKYFRNNLFKTMYTDEGHPKLQRYIKNYLMQVGLKYNPGK
jgi:hypothetical protein